MSANRRYQKAQVRASRAIPGTPYQRSRMAELKATEEWPFVLVRPIHYDSPNNYGMETK